MAATPDTDNLDIRDTYNLNIRDTYNLDTHDDAPLPNLSLVRHVVPEFGKALKRGGRTYIDVVSESRFGDPGEEADLSCVNAGLKEALPSIDIIPTATFWEQVAAPDDVINLSELFVALESDRLRALQADVIVIAYHTEITVEIHRGFFLVVAAYETVDKKTASIIVIDLHRKAIIHGSKISFKDSNGSGYYWVVPMVFVTVDPPEICNTVGRQAGVAIAEAMPGRPVRALVVVAGEDPIVASRIRILQMHHEPSSPMLTDPSASP